MTFGLIAVGGFILGPIVQKNAFDAYWTGIPFGWERRVRPQRPFHTVSATRILFARAALRRAS